MKRKWTLEDEIFIRENYNILTDNELSVKLNRSLRSICHKRCNLECRRGTNSPIKTKEFWGYEGFLPLNTPEQCWVFGLIVTDGCLCKKSLSFSSKDKVLVEAVKSVVGYGTVRKHYKYKSSQYYSISVQSQIIKNRLNKLGLYDRKTKTIKWNDVFNNIPYKYRDHFIRGLWEGDGSISHTHNGRGKWYMTTNFVCGSIDFIEGLCKYISVIAKSNTKVHKCKNKNHWVLSYTGSKAGNICNYIYQNSILTNRLNRKYEKWIKWGY